MELTNKDKKQIEVNTDALIIKVKVDATEYAKLYEKAFYARMIEKLQGEIEVIDYVRDYIKKQ